MRSFKEITNELGSAMDLVIGKKNSLDIANKEAEELTKKANEMRSKAVSELTAAQDKALTLRKEYDDLMAQLLPMPDMSRVRQSK